MRNHRGRYLGWADKSQDRRKWPKTRIIKNNSIKGIGQRRFAHKGKRNHTGKEETGVFMEAKGREI